MPPRSRKARPKARLIGQLRAPETTAVPQPGLLVVPDPMVAPHSSPQVVPETTRTPRSNQLVISDTTTPHPNQQAMPETKTSSNVTNVGMVPFAYASNVVLNNPIFNEAAPEQIASAIKALSKRAIDGAEFDSSARDPPPSCHPGTRTQLLEKIKLWFYDKTREKALLWLSGPAGVGKSAIIQTIAEALAEYKSLGATLFFSRLNDRKDPQRVVATISYQLALRVPAYRIYVAEQITLDPSLLRKGMKEQFHVFIADPLGNKGIGKGEGPWMILLDGLDECEGVDQQREIIRLVSQFVLKFPNAPLLWSISSRPEPHIVAAFTSSAAASSHWSEYIPVDSTEGCQDVERYLNNSFKSMRDQFPRIPSNWPNETQFLKLSNGALGLFVFARTAVRFMEDPNHANPVSRLNLILSVIDHLEVAVTDEHPFALLDALYTHILVSIPPTVWPTTKQILAFFICSRPADHHTNNGLEYPLGSRSLIAVSIILNIEHYNVDSALHKLHSVLGILHSQILRKPGVSFYHASLGDYLTDPIRSKEFFIDRSESVDDITRGLFRVYKETSWDKPEWDPCTSELSNTMRQCFYQLLREDAVTSLYHAVTGDLKSDRGRGPFKSEDDRSECLDFLARADIAELYSSDHGFQFVQWLFKFWNAFPHDLKSRGLVEEALFRDLRVDHLKSEMYVCVALRGVCAGQTRRGTSIPFEIFKTVFQSLQRHHKAKALICGNSPQKRNVFIPDWIPDSDSDKQGFYCFPYPF